MQKLIPLQFDVIYGKQRSLNIAVRDDILPGHIAMGFGFDTDLWKLIKIIVIAKWQTKFQKRVIQCVQTSGNTKEKWLQSSLDRHGFVYNESPTTRYLIQQTIKNVTTPLIQICSFITLKSEKIIAC